MARYFIEVFYKGTGYSGFQTQHNANTIQAEIEKAIEILKKEKIVLTGSSRTDSGVHALQNYFHFDSALDYSHDKAIYNLNAILPADIGVRKIIRVNDAAHCRFDAITREYKYFVYRTKNPFLKDRAFYYPYTLDILQLQAAAEIIKEYTDFTSFSKRNTQVKTFNCKILESNWEQEGDCLVYHVRANRFLRGMVRALTATMLKTGRGKQTLGDFRAVIEAKNCTAASFSVPAHGLFLISVAYPANYLNVAP